MRPIDRLRAAIPGIIWIVAVVMILVSLSLLAEAYNELSRGDFFGVAKDAATALFLAWMLEDFWAQVREQTPA